MCSCGGGKSVRMQNGVTSMLFSRNKESFIMPLRLRKGEVQIQPTAEYFVHGATRRWIHLSEFVDICDESYFRSVPNVGEGLPIRVALSPGLC